MSALNFGMANQSQAELEAELAKVEKKISSGVSSVTVDGTKTDYDLEALERRAKQLRAQIAANKAKRPPFFSTYLGGF